jgi:phage protein D
MAKRALYTVVVGGQDISSRLSPLLTHLTIEDQEGTHSDKCQLEIEDKDGQVLLPNIGDPISVSLGWENEGGMSVVFVGTVDEVKSKGSRGSGRELHISAKGVDTRGKAKEAQQRHFDNKTLQQVLNDAGQYAGISVRVDPSLASIQREWWGMNDESFLHFGERLAREVGGLFKVRGNEAIMAAKDGGSVTGQSVSGVSAAWGDNLIDWDLAPVMGRPKHKKTRSRYYDKKAAKWKKAEEDVKDDDAVAVLAVRHTRPDEDESKHSAKNHARDSEREKGGGSVTIDGTGAAQPGGTCIVVGARPGIDGSYRINSVTHEYSRSGWTTKLDLKQPGSGTGSDKRKKKK